MIYKITKYKENNVLMSLCKSSNEWYVDNIFPINRITLFILLWNERTWFYNCIALL